jgi:hypothetical protein
MTGNLSQPGKHRGTGEPLRKNIFHDAVQVPLLAWTCGKPIYQISDPKFQKNPKENS